MLPLKAVPLFHPTLSIHTDIYTYTKLFTFIFSGEVIIDRVHLFDWTLIFYYKHPQLSSNRIHKLRSTKLVPPIITHAQDLNNLIVSNNLNNPDLHYSFSPLIPPFLFTSLFYSFFLINQLCLLIAINHSWSSLQFMIILWYKLVIFLWRFVISLIKIRDFGKYGLVIT